MQWLSSFLTIIGIGMGLLSPAPPEVHGLVTRVEVKTQWKDQEACCQYTQPEKMEMILDYLRSIQSPDQADLDPERLDVPSTRITVYSSTGASKLYLQRGNTWVSKNYGPWKTIPEAQGKRLYKLLAIPSDE